ncbi:MAG: HDOD domain-containing protein [Desulfobulbaceae bacterium]|nr:HDOD domain-containing protein [Desulfobulbaceae bacterium]
MAKNNFVEVLKNYIESERLTLPVFDAVSLRIQMELIKKEPNFNTVEKLIISDQALSSNLLKIVNSAQCRGLVEISTVKAAIMRIGMSEIARIISMDINRKMFSSRDRQMDAIMKKLWQHSMGCAFVAGLLSNRLDFGVMQNEAFFAGLFHDIGKLLILKVISEKKQKDKSITVSDALLVGAMDLLHTEQGYLLMQQINMPNIFAVVTRDHHSQDFDRDNYLLALVRMANHFCHYAGIGLGHDPTIALLETEEAGLLKLSESDLEALTEFMKSTPTLSG